MQAGRTRAGGGALAAALVAVALLAPAASAAPGQEGSLPSVGSGELPGPPLLYREPAKAPQLRNRAPFQVPPLLVSGTDAYRYGEYLFQDYLYDDYGANTVPGRGSHTPGADDVASQTDGDVFYPAAERYAENAADIVELRIKPKPNAVFYRLTLNTAKEPDAAVVGIGIDTDRSGGEVPWPLGAGVSSPRIDRFITAWGTGGTLAELGDGDRFAPGTPLPPKAVRMDLRRNQMTIRVPRRMLDPGEDAVWRYVAGTGLWDGEGWMRVPAASEPSEERPASGDPNEQAPAVFNLAFRFEERQSFLEPSPYDTLPAAGVWFEAEQARQLAAGTTGPFFADVDFALLESGANMRLHRPRGRTRARIFSSRLRLGEGIESGSFPKYRGRLQPYLITVPPGYRSGPRKSSKGHPQRTPNGAARARPVGLTFTLHSLGGNYTQYATYSPKQIRQLGIERKNIVVSPLARGTDGWYTDEAEVDVFEAWADVAHRYKLDPSRTYPSGYSMGGYGTYKLGIHYPDLWARAFTVVGPPGEGIWIPPGAPQPGGADTNTNPLLENVRWIPYMNWAEVADQLVPYAGVRAQQARFDELGLRSQLWSFAPGEHFTLAVLDQWGPAAGFLADAKRVEDPSRVDYAFFPDADRPELGLVHDHAYWVSDLLVRDGSGDPDSDPARGMISARSLAFGEGDPEAKPLTPGTMPGLNGLNAIEGTEWGPIPPAPAENALELELDNVGSAAIDGRRARLEGAEPLRIAIESDGPAELRVELPLPASASASGGEVALDREGLTIQVPDGSSEITVRPR